MPRDFAIRLPDEGNVYALRNASTTWQLPYGIFAVAIGNVMLPSLAERFGKKDYEGASSLLSSRLKSALFLTIPSAGLMFIMNSYIIKAIFQWGSQYTDADAERAGQFLAGYSIAIITHSIVFIMNQAFYAIGRTRVPLMAGCIGLITNPLCCTLLIPHMGAMALTLSYSITSILQMTILCVVYSTYKELRPKGMLVFLLKSAVSFLAMGTLLTFIYTYTPDYTSKLMSLADLAAEAIVAFFVYFIVSLLLKVEESREVISKMRSFLRKSH